MSSLLFLYIDGPKQNQDASTAMNKERLHELNTSSEQCLCSLLTSLRLLLNQSESISPESADSAEHELASSLLLCKQY